MFENIEEQQYQKLMANLYAYPLGGQLQPPTEDWINSAAKLARRSVSRGRLLLIMSCLACSTVVIFTDKPYGGDYLTAASALLLLFSGSNAMEKAETIFQPLTSGLRKLSDGGNYQKALALVEASERCRTYHSQVLAQGRELLEFDYQLLQSLARKPGCPKELDADAAWKKLPSLAKSQA